MNTHKIQNLTCHGSLISSASSKAAPPPPTPPPCISQGVSVFPKWMHDQDNVYPFANVRVKPGFESLMQMTRSWIWFLQISEKAGPGHPHSWGWSSTGMLRAKKVAIVLKSRYPCITRAVTRAVLWLLQGICGTYFYV